MRRARFWLKAVAAAAALSLLGMVAAALALRSFFPEPRLRAMTVDAAKKQLGRDVRLESIGLGLTGLSLRGIEVSEKPDFSAGTFLRAERFRLRPSWKALLRRRLVVATVAADGLKVRVAKGLDGSFNYESLLSSGTSAPGAKSAEAGAPELDVRRAKVTGGRVEYADMATGAAWTVSDLDVVLRGFSLSSPFGLDVSLRVAGKAGARAVDAKLAFKGDLDLARGDRAAFKARVKKLVVESEGARLTASGEAAGMDAPKIVFDADLSAAGKNLLHAAGSALVGADVEVDLKAKTPGFDTTWLARLAPRAGIPALEVPAAELTVAGKYAPDRVQIRAFSASWKGGKIVGAGSALRLQGPAPAFDGKASFGIDVPEIRPGQYPFLRLPPKASVPPLRLEGELFLAGDELRIGALKAVFKAGSASADGTIRRLGSAKPDPDVSVALALDLPAFRAGDLPVPAPALPPSLPVPAMRVDGTVRISGDDVFMQKLTLKTKGGRVTFDGRVTGALAGAPVPDVAVTADLDLPPLTDKDLPFPQVPAGMRAPSSKWTVDAAYSPSLLRIKSLRVVAGRNDLDVSGVVTDPASRGAFDLLCKCRSFALDELTQLTPKTRDLKLGGAGFFALSVTGRKEKPIFAGKLQFKGVGATVAELPFADFTGTVSFDERRVDVPNLAGKVGDGLLKLDLTVKDYGRAPDIQIEAELDRFDLGRWLAAKNKVQADRKAAKAAAGGSAPQEKPMPLFVRGRFSVGKLLHPNATVDDVKASCELRGVAADLRGLDGDASLRVGGGKLHSVGDMATQSKLVKVMIFPLLVVQKIGRIGGLRLFPDFNDITLHHIAGDYVFKDGLMTLRRSEMDSDAARVSAAGTIDLPKEVLDLVVTAQVGSVAPMDVAVTGTFEQPKSKVDLGKFLADPAKRLIDGLLKR